MEEKKEAIVQKKPTDWTFNILIIIALLIGFIWLLAFTNIGYYFNWLGGTESSFKETFWRIALVASIIFLAGLFLKFWGAAKYDEWRQKDSNVTHLVDSDSQFNLIYEKAKVSYGLQLGDCIRISPLMPYKEAGSVPASRFFLFENILFGRVQGYSLWRQDYIRKITTHLVDRNWVGRNSSYKLWTGEYRSEEHRSIIDTSANKKQKDISVVQDEGSMTEE